MKSHFVCCFRCTIVIACLLTFFSKEGFCLEPPAPGELTRYRADGTLNSRLAFVQRLKNHRFNPALVSQKVRQLQTLQLGEPFSPRSFPYPTGLPSHGAPNILVLLIKFPGFPNRTAPAVFTSKIFGSGDQGDYPYESLRSYYYRSSYEALDINGQVLGWYRAKLPRFLYSGPLQTLRSIRGIKHLIKEALRSFDSSVDFSRFDNDGDGVIDYFCVIWTGPTTGWGSPWWGWCDIDKLFFGKDPFTIDGKRLGVFSWQPEVDTRQEESVFSPRTIIHETGHALGLPDYYDYDAEVGPDGGLGGLDMMDAGQFDHNAFSKWMLGWLTPNSIINGGHAETLRPTAQYTDAVAIMPEQNLFGPLSEFFMVQYRASGQGNDFYLPASGLLIWHVDARLNDDGTNFRFDNSSTEHKLIRLMEADGLEEIETGDGEADAEDFYMPFADKEFSPYSFPDSDNYSGSATGITVNNISGNNLTETGWDSLTADFSIEIAIEQKH
jgi:M6 family metalloprotease-like protein